MNLRQTVTCTGAQGLASEEWEFVLIDAEVRLSRWRRLTRPSRRHKFRVVDWWESVRRDTKHKKPVPPKGVRDEALARMRAQLHMEKG